MKGHPHPRWCPFLIPQIYNTTLNVYTHLKYEDAEKEVKELEKRKTEAV